MREYKFRVRNKDMGESSGHSKRYRFFKCDEEGCELLQYTGLKDDNGTEIYEGDRCKIVYHITHGPHEECEVEVFWDEEIAGFLFGRDDCYSKIELNKVEVI